MSVAPAITTATYSCPECRFRARIDQRNREEGVPVRKRRTCPTCSGTGEVTVDPKAIFEALTVSRGAAKGSLRKSRPALPDEPKGVYGAAYIWRMIRFDNGMDMHMPVMAGDYVGLIGMKDEADKPLRLALEALINAIGNVLFGKVAMMRGAAAWGRVLGMEQGEEVYAKVESAVGMPMGNGYAIGDMEDSPEAAVEQMGEIASASSRDGSDTFYFEVEHAH